MPMRRALTRKQSRRNFRSGGQVKARNFATAMRGGYRI